jgi:HD-GYP domain-containing protein (c-di-GMP phosphodiesterase class II)
MAIAIITRGKTSGRRATIVQWPATIGRDPTSVLQIDDDRVSRYHARIKKRDKLYIIEDLQSRNGTYLNGENVTNCIISSGDRVLIGDTEFVFLTPETQVDLATEMAELEHFALAEDLGDLGGPIAVLGSYEGASPISSKRLASEMGLQGAGLTANILRKIFELQANILSSDDVKECSANILKALHALNGKVSRSVLFIWSPNSRRLIPLAARHTKSTAKFFFSRRALEDVISRKQGSLIAPNSGNATAVSRHRILLPITHLGLILGVIHLEIDDVALSLHEQALDPLRFLIERIAPSIDSFMLRQDLENFSVGMIEAMVATLEAKDTYTHGHSERVSRYSLAIADQMNLDREVKRLLLMSSLCHDLGKIGVPDAILRKASLLTADEYEEVKQHPTIGANIVAHLPNAKRFLSGVKYHHEKWDGSGYPDGLVGEDIPFFGRIVAVADVFDAMISGRSYSGFLEADNAVEKLGKESDLFDPDILKAFTAAWEAGTLTQKTSTKNNSVKEDEDKS